jgi:hypothetical protein
MYKDNETYADWLISLKHRRSLQALSIYSKFTLDDKTKRNFVLGLGVTSLETITRVNIRVNSRRKRKKQRRISDFSQAPEQTLKAEALDEKFVIFKYQFVTHKKRD